MKGSHLQNKACEGNIEKCELIRQRIPRRFIICEDRKKINEKDKTISLKEEMKMEGQASAVSFAVIENSEIDCVGGEGVLNSSDPHPQAVTTKTIFPIASIGKAITAYATIRCLQEYGLNIDKSIDEYLPPVSTVYPFIEPTTSPDKITGEEAVEYINRKQLEPAETLALIAEFKAWVEHNKREIDMSAINDLEKKILEKNEFLYGIYEVRKILQKFKGKGITFRQLLEHSSGIYDDRNIDPNEYSTSVDISIGFLKRATVKPLPDTERTWRYSNAGYVVVECLLESLTGMPFTDVMKQYVFNPLKMQDSTVSQSPKTLNDKSRPVVAGILPDGKVIQHEMTPRACGGGTQMTSKDYAKFMEKLIRVYNDPKEDPVKQMFVEQTRKCADGGNPCHYCLGLFVQGEGENVLFNHRGGMRTCSSEMAIYPKQERAAVVLTNGNLSPELVSQTMSAIAKTYSWPIYKKTETAILTPIPENEFSKYVGTYEIPGPDGTKVKIFITNNPPSVQLPWPTPTSSDQPIFKLFQDNAGNIFDENFNIKIGYDDKEKTVLFYLPKHNPAMKGERIDQPELEKTSDLKPLHPS